jgi:outer membrane protein OmpA-like peptidoglycan-associated protein
LELFGVNSIASLQREGKDMLPTKSMLVTGAVLASLALLSPVNSALAQSGPGGSIILAQQQEPPKAGEEKGKKDEHRPTGQNKPGQPQAPAAQQNTPPQPGKPGQPKNAQEQPQGHPPAAQGQAPQHPTAQEELRKQSPAGQTPSPQPSTAQQPNQKQLPASAQEHQEHQEHQDQLKHSQPVQTQTTPNQMPANQTPTAQQPNQKSAPALGQQSNPQKSPTATQTQPTQAPTAQAVRPGALPPPTAQVRQSHDFIRAPGQQAAPGIASLRQERHEVREGNRVFIQEPGRTIIQDGGHTIIRHDEVDRFTVGARNVHNERRGNQTVSIIERPDGSRIESVLDDDGRLIRRTRRDAGGREIIIIDNSWVTPDRSVDFVVELPVPVINIPRERYIVDMDRAVAADIFAALTAPPIERIGRRYSLDEVRYSPMLRDRMPRVDLDTITFDTGSWQIGPEQFDKLAGVADALQRVIARNPREVFLIEGHTDAVGSDVDNLSLSDRRAETVAVVLTEQFHVPAENLSTQGYGSQFLKIPTQEAERQNRRVAVRRITPLIDPDERAGG